MARGISAQEREQAITILDGEPTSPIFGDDADTENAWQQWAEELKSSESKGIIRIAKVPMQDGVPNLAKKGQVQLMTVPHDQFTLDGVLDLVRQRFMRPGDTVCLRLTGIRTGGSGHSGVVPFNRIVMVERAAEPDKTETVNSQVGDMVKGILEAQAQQAAMIKDMVEARVPAKPEKERDTLDVVLKLTAAFTPLLTPVFAALLNRGPQKSEMGELIDAMVKLKTLTGNEGGSSDDDNSTASIIKAVAPAGLQLLGTLAQNQQIQRRLPAARATPVSPPQIPQRPVEGGSSKPAAVNPEIHSSEEQRPVSTAAQTVDSGILQKIEEPVMFGKFDPRPMIRELIPLAAQNADIGETVTLITNLLPPEADESLYGLIETPQKFQALFLLVPEARPHAIWFEQVRAALLKEFEEEPPSAPSV